MKNELEKQKLDALMDIENSISIAEQEEENLRRMNKDALLSLETVQRCQGEQELLSSKYDGVSQTVQGIEKDENNS